MRRREPKTQTQQLGAVATELPSKRLPPATYQDLPEPMPLRRVIGPSVVLAAAAMGSGEFIVWPYLSSQIGLVFLWAAILGVLTQFFIHLEMERYTLATGETVVTGYARLWRPWAPLFVIFMVLAHVWPGWAASAATMATFVLGGGNPTIIAVLGLIAIGVAVTLSPVVYQFVEKAQMIMVAAMVIFLVIAISRATDPRSWGDFVVGLGHFGQLPSGVEMAVLLTAVVFAGGGAGDPALCNWIRDKSLGMGARVPKIVSPITGQEEAKASTGFVFPCDEANLSRWRRWWRLANIEHLITFVAIALLSIIGLSVLAYATVFGQDLGEGLAFIQAEGRVLSELVGPWFGILFWTGGTVFLLSTSLGNLDIVSRITSDALKNTFLHDNKFWSESKLYLTVVWGMIIVGSAIMLVGLSQPLALLVIAGTVSALVVFINAVMLIVINRRSLPGPIRLRGYRLGIMIWAVLFFGFFLIITLADQVGTLLGG